MNGKWTPSEIDILLASEGKAQPNIPGRSPESIRQKLMRLGVKNKAKNPQWTEIEISILKEAAEKGVVPFVEGRSNGSVRNKMVSLGFQTTGRKEWQESELAILKSHKGQGLPEVHGRSSDAVRFKMKELGLLAPKNKIWSDKEIEQLKMKVLEPCEIEIPGRTKAAIFKKIHDLDLLPKYLEVRGKQKSNLKWSEEEINMVKQGRKRIPGRSVTSIMNMRRRLGFKTGRRPRPYWTPEKEKTLRSLHSKGMSARDIALFGSFPGRSRMAIQKKLCRMGLAKKMEIKKLPKKMQKSLVAFVSENWRSMSPVQMKEKWNEENPRYSVNKARVLKTLRVVGVRLRSSMPMDVRRRFKNFVNSQWKVQEGSPKEKLALIVESWKLSCPQHPVSRVQVRALALGLSLMKRAMPKTEKEKLRKFLFNKWEGRTPDELAEMWNLESQHKVNRLLIVRMLKDMNLKISCSEVKRMNALKKREKEIMSRGASSHKALDEMIRAERVKMMRARFGKNRDIFTGMDVDGEESEVLAETSC